jgi:hypothetical protein
LRPFSAEDEGVDGEELLEKVFDSRRGIANFFFLVAQSFEGGYVAGLLFYQNRSYTRIESLLKD